MKNQLLGQLLDSLDSLYGGECVEFEIFRDDPVGFAENVLKVILTPDQKRLMLSVKDNPSTLARSANGPGKSFVAAIIAIWFFKCFPGAQVYLSCAPPQKNLESILFGEIGAIIEGHPALFERDQVLNLFIGRSAKCFIQGVSIPTTGTEAQRQAKFSGKHAPYLLFIFDEADGIPPEVFTAAESCMSGGHARLLCLFNPREERGHLYQMERDGRANVVTLSAMDHPNVINGTDDIPGAVNRETVVRRVNEWTRPLAEGEKSDATCFELPDFLVDAVARSQKGTPYPPLEAGAYKIIDPNFSVMVLGDYPSQASNQLISREWILAARERFDAYVREKGDKPPAYSSGVMGVDVAEQGNDANCCCFRYGGFVSPLMTWGGVDITVTANRAAEEYKKRNVSRANVDATGVGSGVAPLMSKAGCAARAVKVASSSTTVSDLGEFDRLRDQLYWEVREWLRTDPGAMLPPDEDLTEELAVPTYEVKKGKVCVMRKSTMKELLRRSPDRLDALALTFHRGGLFSGCIFQ